MTEAHETMTEPQKKGQTSAPKSRELKEGYRASSKPEDKRIQTWTKKKHELDNSHQIALMEENDKTRERQCQKAEKMPRK